MTLPVVVALEAAKLRAAATQRNADELRAAAHAAREAIPGIVARAAETARLAAVAVAEHAEAKGRHAEEIARRAAEALRLAEHAAAHAKHREAEREARRAAPPPRPAKLVKADKAVNHAIEEAGHLASLGYDRTGRGAAERRAARLAGTVAPSGEIVDADGGIPPRRPEHFGLPPGAPIPEEIRRLHGLDKPGEKP